jgi:hypothetical protein
MVETLSFIVTLSLLGLLFSQHCLVLALMHPYYAFLYCFFMMDFLILISCTRSAQSANSNSYLLPQLKRRVAGARW